MIEVRNLTKRFGSTTAVDDVSFDVAPGRVTGFLGPNGAGKSTAMRCMVGLDRSDAGNTSFAGREYHEFSSPMTEVGVLLDAGYVHPARSGRNHLRWLAASNGIAYSRVEEALTKVGLADVAKRKLRSYSLGMRQRLGLAAALLGDPSVYILDEPANGLDPEGIRWTRDLLKELADEGRSVLVSSHLLSEMALMADDLIVIGRGKLIDQGRVADFIERYAQKWVRVRSPEVGRLVAAAIEAGGTQRPAPADSDPMTAEVLGLPIERVGDLAMRHKILLHELTTRTESLEDAFLRATASAQEFRAEVAS